MLATLTHKLRPSSGLQANAALALSYFVFANLARGFAIPPDNFAPFFVPAGIALAACASYGPRMLPGVAFGALAFNLTWFLNLDTGLSVRAMAPALAVTTGSVLQAWLGSLMFARLLCT